MSTKQGVIHYSEYHGFDKNNIYIQKYLKPDPIFPNYSSRTFEPESVRVIQFFMMTFERFTTLKKLFATVD